MVTTKRLMRFVAYLSPVGCTAVALVWFVLANDPQASAQQAAPPPANQVLRVYPCTPGTAQTLAAQLRQQYRGVPGVRIGADDRLGQVLVQATPAIQAQIAQRLTPPPPVHRPQTSRVAPQAPQTFPPSAPVAARGPRSQPVQLRYTTAQQIEAALLRTLGKRLTPVLGGIQAAREYRLDLPAGGQINLSIDYRANRAIVQGTGPAVDSCVRLIQALDNPKMPAGRSLRLASLQRSSPASVRQVVSAVRQGAPDRSRGQLVTMLFQPPDEAAEEEAPEAGRPGVPTAGRPPFPENGGPPPANGQLPEGMPPEGVPQGGLIGPVRIEMLEGLDVLVITGHERDVERVMAIIEQIEALSAETEPVIVVHRLRHVNCEALTELVTPLYENVYEPRQGGVSITALVKPNAVLVVGRKENVQTVVDLLKRLDRKVDPETEFHVFSLRHAAATTAQAAIMEQFGDEPAGLGARVVITADFRSNALIVRAGPRDMLEVAKLIEQIDTPTTPAVNELRVFELYHSRAEDLETLLEEAIQSQAARPSAPGAAGAPGAPGAPGRQAEQKSVGLEFVTVDRDGQRRVRSGILTDVRITANPPANTLVVSAPADSMELIEAVIRQLDQPPVAEAFIKVFHIVNGDAVTLRSMLETLFAPAQGGEPAAQTAAVEGESSLVTLRFVEDVRTNSIVASGTEGDLLVVHAILTRLDETDVRQRQTEVYALKNAPAFDVANAIEQYLQRERQVLTQISGELLSAFEQIEREVVVVPEVVSNSLIISATPRFFEEIMDLVKKLDQRPAMVMIQVLLAEVTLNNTDEFGVELGLQDSVLFDRSLLEVLDRITTTTIEQGAGGASTTTTTEDIVSATITPGFPFNNQPLGNATLAGARILGAQGLSTFGVSRLNTELGYGGLVLSASNDIASILIRALKEKRCLNVLSRPQIMTMDNQPAYIMVGQAVPLVSSVTTSEVGQTFNTGEPTDVGLLMSVWPRVSPDDMVVMEINAEKSEVGPEAEGIPIFISATGEVVRSPRINKSYAQTTVLAADGQTVVIGGLITKSKEIVNRKVPLLADIPLLGALFRYDRQIQKRTELLIILTPHVIRDQDDAETIKQVEAARMNWCLCDVLKLTDDAGLRSRSDEWLDSETHVVYPDINENAVAIPELNQVPGQQPTMAPPNGAPPAPRSIPNANGMVPPAARDGVPPPPTPVVPRGAGPQAVYGPGPIGPGWPQTTAGQRPYQSPAYPGNTQPAGYQWTGTTGPHPYSHPGRAVQSGYARPFGGAASGPTDGKPPQNRWPAGPPVLPYRSPAAQPAQYNQPYQP